MRVVRAGGAFGRKPFREAGLPRVREGEMSGRGTFRAGARSLSSACQVSRTGAAPASGRSPSRAAPSLVGNPLERGSVPAQGEAHTPRRDRSSRARLRLGASRPRDQPDGRRCRDPSCFQQQSRMRGRRPHRPGCARFLQGNGSNPTASTAALHPRQSVGTRPREQGIPPDGLLGGTSPPAVPARQDQS
jgi:hypothetical protein